MLRALVGWAVRLKGREYVAVSVDVTDHICVCDGTAFGEHDRREFRVH